MTARTVTVLTAVTGAWEAPLAAGLERSAADVRVVRRCVDLAELLSVAAAGLARAAVVSGDLPRFDREAVRALGDAGVAVVGLAEPGDAPGAARLAELGVAAVLPADADVEVLVAAVSAAVESLAVRPPVRPGTGGAAEPAGPAGPTGTPPPRGPADPGDPPPPPGSAQPGGEGPAPGTAGRPERIGRGRVVAVWGPTGAPGRTTVAVTLASELAALGGSTLLVDADTYGASVAQTLGMLDESAGLAAAARAANQGSLDGSRLLALAPEVADRLRVLTGLPQPRRWPELRPAALEVVWDRAAELFGWTVVDCGFALDSDEEVSFDTAVPRRNGATLSALRAADAVVAVGSCDPVGLQRLVRGLHDLTAVLPSGRAPTVVITRVRAGSVGPSPAERVSRALDRYAGVECPVLVPDDRDACDAAALAGRSLTEQAPSSPARLAVASLAREMAGLPTGRTRRHGPLRWRRRRAGEPAGGRVTATGTGQAGRPAPAAP